MVYIPDSFVVTLKVRLVANSVTLTLAWATGEPTWSLTSPVNPAWPDCAFTVNKQTHIVRKATPIAFRLLLNIPALLRCLLTVVYSFVPDYVNDFSDLLYGSIRLWWWKSLEQTK
jgi:hypothetical protein